MSELRLDLGDAIELAELLTFLTDWLSGSQQQTLTDSLTAFIGHPAYDTNNLAADHGQPDRAALFDGLIRRVETTADDHDA